MIAPTVLTDFAPTYCDPNGSNLMTQFDMVDVEQAGLVKFDFLGLRTLTIVQNAVKSINGRLAARGEDPIDIDAVGLDDSIIYRDLAQAKTTAVFQLESRGMKDLLKKVKPNRFSDIVALVALFRPGPLQLAPNFIDRKHGREEIDYMHPSLERILESTYGVMLYQEQVMQIAQVLAGYTLADADLLRRAMGKKKKEEMDKQRAVFMAGAAKNDVDEKTAEKIFGFMEAFAGYGFNKPHSVCYALVAYQTAWLKHYYPADFMAAVMSADMQTTDKVVVNIQECREMGLNLLPPDVNMGEYRFVASADDTIVYGLGAIKGLGEGVVEAITREREAGGPFTSLFDFCDRVGSDANKKAIEALVGSGALDSLVPERLVTVDEVRGFRRALLARNQSQAIKLADQKARNAESGNIDLFGEVTLTADPGEVTYQHLEDFQPWDMQERLNQEKANLGLFLTGHPIEIYRAELKHLAKTRLVDLRAKQEDQVVIGLVVAMRAMRGKNGEMNYFLTLDDRTARVEVPVFSDAQVSDPAMLSKDNVIVVRGATADDDFTGGISVRAEEVYSLEEARARNLNRLRLKICATRFEDDFTGELRGVLEAHRDGNGGGCPVTIAYERHDASALVRLGEEWRVRPSDDLIRNLRDRYGAAQVHLDYA